MQFSVEMLTKKIACLRRLCNFLDGGRIRQQCMHIKWVRRLSALQNPHHSSVMIAINMNLALKWPKFLARLLNKAKKSSRSKL